MAEQNNLQDFENKIEKLEKLVELLESGELSLQRSLIEFENGVKLYTDCKKALELAEKKVSKLSEQLKEIKLDE
ncbi:MAG: hypothetical protein Fur0010_00680 [Bdellovibrio sp.]